jgi:hypothetical protein
MTALLTNVRQDTLVVAGLVSDIEFVALDHANVMVLALLGRNVVGCSATTTVAQA